MILSINNTDSTIVKDGNGIECSIDLPENIHAIFWNGKEGEIEYKDGSKNKKIKDIYEIPNFNKNMDKYISAKKKLIPSAYHTWNDNLEDFELTDKSKEKMKKDLLNKKIKKVSIKQEKDLRKIPFAKLPIDEMMSYVDDNTKTLDEMRDFLKETIKFILART